MRYFHVVLNLTREIVSRHNQHIKPQHQSNMMPVSEERYTEMFLRSYFDNQVTKKAPDGEMLLIGVEYIRE
jgi:hypothetical protein